MLAAIPFTHPTNSTSAQGTLPWVLGDSCENGHFPCSLEPGMDTNEPKAHTHDLDWDRGRLGLQEHRGKPSAQCRNLEVSWRR